MRLRHFIDEASYIGNIGFEEMVKFHELATTTDLRMMQKIAEKEDWVAFKRLIQKVVGTQLKEGTIINRMLAPSNEKFISTIRKDCRQWLAESKGEPVYRGMLEKSQWGKFAVRQNRRPRDTNILYHNIVNDSFKDNFGWSPRSEGLFITGEEDTASLYGGLYIIFPIGKYRYLWSPDVRDILALMPGSNKIDMDEHEKFLKRWEKLLPSYQTKNLAKAIKSGHEIMVQCNEYYALEWSLWNLYDWDELGIKYLG